MRSRAAAANAFLCCAAVLKSGSEITIDGVSLNNARTGFLRTLERMGVDVRVTHQGHEGKEPYGSITVSTPGLLRGCEVPAQHIASLVDEIPVLALVAAHARGVTVFRRVEELRVKETDRLQATMDGLSQLGIDAWVEGSDLCIEGDPTLEVPEGLVFNSYGDHRLAMTWALVGLTGNEPVRVLGFESVDVSYPNFLIDLQRLGS